MSGFWPQDAPTWIQHVPRAWRHICQPLVTNVAWLLAPRCPNLDPTWPPNLAQHLSIFDDKCCVAFGPKMPQLGSKPTKRFMHESFIGLPVQVCLDLPPNLAQHLLKCFDKYCMAHFGAKMSQLGTNMLYVNFTLCGGFSPTSDHKFAASPTKVIASRRVPRRVRIKIGDTDARIKISEINMRPKSPN